MPKSKQQEAQEKRLQRNIRQAGRNRADAKKGGHKGSRTRPPGKNKSIFGLSADAPADSPAEYPVPGDVPGWDLPAR